MRDVASEAGVSPTTVSHVLNASRFVSPEAVLAVRRAIERTGYVNDGIARSLRTGKTGTIGLCISAITNPYFGTVVHNIERSITDDGMSLLLVDTHDDPEREAKVTTDLLARRPDGILLAPSASPERAIDLIANRGIPIVLIDRVPPWAPDDRFDAIGVDNAQPMTAIVDHLVELGHDRIALITGQRGLYTTEERIEGFVRGLHDHVADADPVIIEGVRDHQVNPHAIDELLATPDPPTAVVTGNNQVTIEAVSQLAARDLQIPRDISLAAFDDFEWADHFHPRLTAVRQPVEHLAQRAVELLRERLADPTLPGRVERIAPRLIVRDSAIATR